jgi:hypothetical protein
MCHLHLLAIGAGVGNSVMYFLQCTTFAYGSQLVQDNEIKFDDVFR